MIIYYELILEIRMKRKCNYYLFLVIKVIKVGNYSKLLLRRVEMRNKRS